MNDISKTIGERIRIYRTKKNLSQDALGEISDTHGKYIGQLERGEKNAGIVIIEKIARALDLPLEVLFKNIVSGETKDDIPNECYNLISSMSEKEQKAILELIRKAIEFKNT